MRTSKTNWANGYRLARNVIWNLLGTGAPLIVGLFSIPMLIEGLGVERFGILTLAWMVVGYFSLFDLGISRALTKLVAERLGNGQLEEIPALIWMAMLLMLALGILGAIIAAGCSHFLVASVLNIPVELQAETLNGFYLLAISIPIVISTAGLRGVLEAHQRFGLVNIVRIPLGIFIFLGPLLVLPFSSSLFPVIAVLIVARLVSFCAYVALCLKVEPSLRHSFSFESHLFKPLIRFGSWMTVTNIVGPMMVYMDRFLIGSVLAMSAVAYYATPYEVVTKLWIFSGALMGVLFPAFSTMLKSDRIRAAFLCKQAVKILFLLMFPVVLIIVTYAYEGLNFWIGQEFANNSTVVLQLLAIGVLINSHAQIPFGMIQANGRPDLTAKLHLLELPVYLLVLWGLVNNYGIVGAAVAWLLRVTFDTLILFGMAYRDDLIDSRFEKTPVIMIIGCLFMLYAGVTISGIIEKGVFLAIVIAMFIMASWLYVLSKNEKKKLSQCLIKKFKLITSVNKGFD